MNTPNIRFKVFSDAWEQRKLGDVLQFQNGFNGGREVYGEGTAFISVMDILNNPFITYDCIRGKATVSDAELERFSVRYGDVLFQRSSENVEDAGTSNVYIDRDNTAVFGGFVIRGKQIAPYSPKFMKYLLDTKPVRNQITKKAQGAQHVNVSQETLQDVQISLPNQGEQIAIENCLYNLDNLITLHQRKCDSLKQVKKYMLQKMFPKQGEKVPEIRFAGFTGDWEQRKLGEFFSERSDRANGNEELLSVTIANGVIKQADSDKRNTASEDKSNYKIVKKGDVPYNSMRMWQGAVGTSDYDGIVSPAYTVLKPENNNNGKFFMELFKKQSMLEIFKRWSQGLTSDTWNLKFPTISTIVVAAPNIEEQAKIADYFSNFDNLITLHQRKSDSLKEIKKFMLQNMFPRE